MRSKKTAAEGDRRTALSVCERAVRLNVSEQDATAWVEDGVPVPGSSGLASLVGLIASSLEAERERTAVEVATLVGSTSGFGRNDHVRVKDPSSRHAGKNALVWFVRDGRVTVCMSEPGSQGGSVSDSFLPEHLERLDDPAPVRLERAVLLRFMRENAQMHDNLTSTQTRCTQLLEATRGLRRTITGLGGEDPGPQ